MARAFSIRNSNSSWFRSPYSLALKVRLKKVSSPWSRRMISNMSMKKLFTRGLLMVFSLLDDGDGVTDAVDVLVDALAFQVKDRRQVQHVFQDAGVLLAEAATQGLGRGVHGEVVTNGDLQLH